MYVVQLRLAFGGTDVGVGVGAGVLDSRSSFSVGVGEAVYVACGVAVGLLVRWPGRTALQELNASMARTMNR